MWIERDDLEGLIVKAVEAEQATYQIKIDKLQKQLDEETERAERYRTMATRLKHQRDDSWNLNETLRTEIKKLNNKIGVLKNDSRKKH